VDAGKGGSLIKLGQAFPFQVNAGGWKISSWLWLWISQPAIGIAQINVTLVLVALDAFAYVYTNYPCNNDDRDGCLEYVI